MLIAGLLPGEFTICVLGVHRLVETFGTQEVLVYIAGCGCLVDGHVPAVLAYPADKLAGVP